MIYLQEYFCLKLQEFQRNHQLMTISMSQVRCYLEEMFGESPIDHVLKSLHASGDIVYKGKGIFISMKF